MLAGSYKGSISNNISIYKTILQKIAYKMYSDGIQQYVGEDYVLGVILDYKENHSNAKLKATDVIKQLIDFRFLECRDDKYKFRHSYMYYYFVGSYIENELPPKEKKQIIRHVFENIEEDVNYNIALFLAYEMNIEYQIIPLVKELAEPLLNQYKDFRYDDIKKLIESWGGNIEKKVEYIYDIPRNEDIPIIRERRLEELEEKEAERDVDEEEQETDKAVKKINKDVLKVGRYVDFMGNILKNYSGKMENAPREEGIDFIFNSVSKVIGSFCGFFEYMVDKIIQMIEEKNKESDENDVQIKSEFVEAIKSTFAEILFTFIEANLMGVASSLDSDILKENIASYCELHNSEFVKMAKIEYLIRISTIRLPVEEINALFKGRESLSEVSKSILKDNVYKYLTSFQYDARDRQMVCATLGFSNKDLLIQERKLAALSEK